MDGKPAVSIIKAIKLIPNPHPAGFFMPVNIEDKDL
jgi:hypothetical protein